MLGLLLMAAGILLLCGAKNIAGEIVKGVLAAILVLSLLPCLLRSCATVELPGSASTSSLGFGLLLFLVLGLIGLIAWRWRTDRAKRHDLWTKRNGSPRSRALPSPPANDQYNGGSHAG
jgi:hypothetical protein